MTQISVQVQTPGAADSAIALNRAADAVEKLAKGMEHQRAASAAAATETKKAAQAARELADAEARAAKAAADADAAWVQRGRQATISPSYGTTPDWARGGGGPGGNGARASQRFLTGDRISAFGQVAGQAVPGLGPVSSALMTGNAWAGPFAALVASVGIVAYAMDKAAKKAQEAADSFAVATEANKRVSKAQEAADQAGLSVYERTRKNAMLTAGRGGDAALGRAQAIARSEGISIDDALSITANGLDGNGAKAAILASKTLGIGIDEAAGKINSGRWRGTPEQIAAGISGGRVNAREIRSRAAKIAGSDYGLYSDVIDRESSASSLDEFALIPRARQGAINRGRGYRDMNDVPGSVARDINDEFTTKAGSTADADQQRIINEQKERALSEVAPGKKLVNGALR